MNLKTFEKIDRLANLSVGTRNNNCLYEAARDSIPLSFEISNLLSNSIGEGSSVIIASGFPVVPEERPETDGPPGTIALANALMRIGAKTTLILDETNLEVHLNLIDELEMEGIEVEKISTDIVGAREFCLSLLKEQKPGLLMSIEKPGMNQNGVHRDMKGNEITGLVGKVDSLFSKAREEEIPTIGIGDGGNEIGMGNISHTVGEKIPNGRKIASTTEVDQLFVSTVSNWGAYGIVSGLSILEGVQLMHKEDRERELIEKCVDSGALDGITKEPKSSVDGISCHINEKVVGMFHHLVDRELKN